MKFRQIPAWARLFIFALLVGGILSIFSSTNPDGLNRVAFDTGFSTQQASAIKGIFPNYGIPGISPAWLAKGLAGFLGTLFVFAIIFGIPWLVSRIKKSSVQKG